MTHFIEHLISDPAAQNPTIGMPAAASPNEVSAEQRIEILRSSRVADAATLLNMTQNAVRIERQRLGLRGIRLKAWRPEETALIGTAPDENLAELLGRSVSSVTKRRLYLERKHRAALKNRPWSEEDIKLLGTATDAQVAQKTGRTPRQVAFMRRAMGIASFESGSS